MTTMRAKFVVEKVEYQTSQFNLYMSPVTDAPYNSDGESEDNSFSRWTPGGLLQITVTNPNLYGKFEEGQKFYLDFTEATQAPPADIVAVEANEKAAETQIA